MSRSMSSYTSDYVRTLPVPFWSAPSEQADIQEIDLVSNAFSISMHSPARRSYVW